MISKSKIYNTFGVFLKRKKIEHNHALAKFLIEKFSLAKKPSDWQSITVEDLKSKGILPSEAHLTFSSWRNEMIKKNILVCMATKEELSETKATHKASLFKYGNVISKYIDQSVTSALPYKVENLFEKYDDLNDRIDSKADNDRVDRLETEVKVLKENVNNLTSIVLEAFPPDTPVRRKIVQDNINNKEECIKLLAKEIEKNIQNTGKMFN